MKGVILAGGEGKQLSPYTENKPKALIRILGKELILHTIHRLKINDVTEITIVVKENQNQIKELLGSGEHLGVSINFLHQKKPFLQGAIDELASHFSDEEGMFILLHVDIISRPGILGRLLNTVNSSGNEMGVGISLKSSLKDFGYVKLNPSGLIEKIQPPVESAIGSYVTAGTFVLSGKIFKNYREGKALHEYFNEFIAGGGLVSAGIWNEPWVDLNFPWQILKATELKLSLLKNLLIEEDVEIDSDARITGPAIIKSGTRILKGATITGPVYIGKNTLIGNNTLIRSGTVIEDGAVVGMGCEVKNSILFENSTVARLSYIGDSIIGNDTTVYAGCVTLNHNQNNSPIYIKIRDKESKIPFKKFGAIVGNKVRIYPNCTLYPGSYVENNRTIISNTVIRSETSEK